MRSRIACGTPAHGLAAVNFFPASDSDVAAIDRSVGSEWLTVPAANVEGRSYVPGTLQFKASPLADMLRIRYCALQPPAASARADRGLTRNEIGSPVAMARRPMAPAPASQACRDCRRVTVVVFVVMASSYNPMATEVGARQAVTNVDFSASPAVAPAAIAAA